MSIFDEYQEEGPIPGRPWWSRTHTGALKRTDGHACIKPATVDAAVKADRRHPMDVPLPMVGQVWADPEDNDFYMLAGFMDNGTPYRLGVIHGLFEASTKHAEVVPFEEWPPYGHVLVWGPGAPWAGPDYEAGP